MARSEMNYTNKSVKQVLKEHKDRVGAVELVKISDRTTIELPAHLSPEEKNARIMHYKEMHKTNV